MNILDFGCKKKQDKTSSLYVFTTGNNTKQYYVSQNAVCFDQAKLKNAETYSCRCLHFRNCKRLCVNIVGKLQH